MSAGQQNGNRTGDDRLRVAAIKFLNPAPLMWNFDHEPHASEMASRYRIEWMMPAACADRLALPAEDPFAADIGLIPVASLATTPGLRILPGCAIASKHRVRSILLVRRLSQPLTSIQTVAADISSRASLAYTRVLFRKWWNSQAVFLPHYPDLDPMLEVADAAILIGDPALFTLEERQNREERTGESLVYHDLAEEWVKLTGVPWVSAVWAIRESSVESHGHFVSIASDFVRSRLDGERNLEALTVEWSARLPLSANTIRRYLTGNIFYDLDSECLEGLQRFFELAEETGVLPSYRMEIAPRLEPSSSG